MAGEWRGGEGEVIYHPAKIELHLVSMAVVHISVVVAAAVAFGAKNTPGAECAR